MRIIDSCCSFSLISSLGEPYGARSAGLGGSSRFNMRALLWIRYGVCICLGLVVIGVAAVAVPSLESNAPSMPQPEPDGTP